MNRPWSALFVLMIGFHVNAFCATAQTSSSIMTAASLGAGGTGRASVEAGDIHDLNPAMLVHVKGRDIHTSVQADSWILGFTDNTPDSLMPGALAVVHSRFGEDLNETYVQDLRLSLGGFVGKSVSFGMTGHQIEATRSNQTWKRIAADAGFAWIATSRLGVALVFHDAMGGRPEDLPADLQLQPRTAIGFNYLLRDTMRLRLDLVTQTNNNFGHPSALLGYEALLTEFTVARLGYASEREFQRETWAVGAGLNLPRFRLNYAFQSVLKGDFETRHSVDLGIPF